MNFVNVYAWAEWLIWTPGLLVGLIVAGCWWRSIRKYPEGFNSKGKILAALLFMVAWSAVTVSIWLATQGTIESEANLQLREQVAEGYSLELTEAQANDLLMHDGSKRPLKLRSLAAGGEANVQWQGRPVEIEMGGQELILQLQWDGQDWILEDLTPPSRGFDGSLLNESNLSETITEPPEL